MRIPTIPTAPLLEALVLCVALSLGCASGTGREDVGDDVVGEDTTPDGAVEDVMSDDGPAEPDTDDATSPDLVPPDETGEIAPDTKPPDLCPEDACSPELYPPAETGGATLYVNNQCCLGGEALDGGLERPFHSIQAALDAAAGGDAVVVAPGAYQEHLLIEHPLSLVGAGMDWVTLQGKPGFVSIRVIPPEEDDAGPEGAVLIRGLTIDQPFGAGMYLKALDVTVEAVRVQDAQVEGEKIGHGVIVTAGANVTLKDSIVAGSAGTGILYQEAIGIIVRNLVMNNAGGGISILMTPNDEFVLIEDCDIADNQKAGIALSSGRANVTDCRIVGTTFGGGYTSADGIHAGRTADSLPESQLHLSDSVVAGNLRLGLLLSNETISIIVRNLVANNGSTGCWAQGNSFLEEFHNNALVSNNFSGLALASGAHGSITDNLIADTRAADFQQAPDGPVMFAAFGDGIAVLHGIHDYEITGNYIVSNGRAMMIFDDVEGHEATDVSDNHPAEDGLDGLLADLPEFDEVGWAPTGQTAGNTNAAHGIVTQNQPPESSLSIDPLENGLDAIEMDIGLALPADPGMLAD